MKRIYIYGASGHGLVVADIAKACGYEEILFVDDGSNEYPSFEDIKADKGIPVALGVGSNKIRKKLFEKLLGYDFEPVHLIHPSAIISESAVIGIGTVVMPNVVINAKSKIGKGVILNSSCVIEHENSIGDFVHISPGAALAGNVTIKESTHIGIGSSIIQGIRVGKQCMIGSASNIVCDIDDNKLAYGNPCTVIKDLDE